MGGRGANSGRSVKAKQGMKYKLNLQYFASKRNDVIYPGERLRVESEVRTWFRDNQINEKTFEKAIGNYIYTVRHEGHNNDDLKYTFTILGKRRIINDKIATHSNSTKAKRRNLLKSRPKKRG